MCDLYTWILHILESVSLRDVIELHFLVKPLEFKEIVSSNIKFTWYFKIIVSGIL